LVLIGEVAMWALVQVALPTLLVERNTLWQIEHQELLSDCSLTWFICFSSCWCALQIFQKSNNCNISKAF